MANPLCNVQSTPEHLKLCPDLLYGSNDVFKGVLGEDTVVKDEQFCHAMVGNNFIFGV